MKVEEVFRLQVTCLLLLFYCFHETFCARFFGYSLLEIDEAGGELIQDGFNIEFL